MDFILTDEQRQLAEENHNLIYKFASKYEIDLELYYGILAIAYCKACRDFQKEKGTLATISFKYMMFGFLREKQTENTKRRTATVVSLDRVHKVGDSEWTLGDILPSDVDLENEIVNSTTVGELFALCNKDSQKRILSELMNGLLQSEVADKVGCSRQNVNSLLKSLNEKYTNGVKKRGRPKTCE